MRVLFDGFWWTAGPTANRVVQRELVRGWRQEFEQDEIVVAVRRSHLAQASGDLPPRTEVVTTRFWPHGLSNLTELGRLGRRTGADVIVAHNYTPRSRRAATFVHDAMFLDHPEWFSMRERVYFSAMLPSARRALVTATSTRTEAARIGRLEPRLPPVTAIGLAVSTELATAEPVRPADVPAFETFALCVGRLNVRKNLAAVIAAAGASRSATPRTPLLVVGGAEYSGVGAPVPAELREHVASGAVRFLGRVSDAELAWLYQHAAVTVCLSLDEGFGLPALEALHFGSPVLASDIEVFRETVGGYATFVDPTSPVEELAEAFDEAWGRPGPEAARRRALKQYTWPAAVRRLRAAIEGRTSGADPRL